MVNLHIPTRHYFTTIFVREVNRHRKELMLQEKCPNNRKILFVFAEHKIFRTHLEYLMDDET